MASAPIEVLLLAPAAAGAVMVLGCLRVLAAAVDLAVRRAQCTAEARRLLEQQETRREA